MSRAPRSKSRRERKSKFEESYGCHIYGGQPVVLCFTSDCRQQRWLCGCHPQRPDCLGSAKTSGQDYRNLVLFSLVFRYVQLADVRACIILHVVAQVASFSGFGLESGMWMDYQQLRDGMRFGRD